MTRTTSDLVTDFLAQHAPFNQMAAGDIDFLVERLTAREYTAGEVVIGPEDGVAERLFIIQNGAVHGFSGEGEAATWELIAGECFPVGALLTERAVHMTSRAAVATDCLELGRGDFQQLLKRSPVFQDFCTRRMANLLDDALRNIQAGSASRVAEGGSLNTPCRHLIRRRPATCTPETPLHEALGTMARERIGSIVIRDEERRPLGILTLHDTLIKVTLPALSLTTPIGEVMRQEVLTIGPEEPAYEAAILMTRHGRGHLCVVDPQRRLLGILSERDLFSLQRVGLVNLSRTIASAESVGQLVTLSQEIHRLVEQMLAQGASVDQLNRIITELNDAITQRVIELNLATFGPAPAPWVWLSFGSEGRIEQTLKTDQDNGILFIAAEEEREGVRKRLLELAGRINRDLDRCGFPLCPGNIMASNPECCLTLEEWRGRFSRWIDQGTPEHLLYATIFFDFRPLYGDPEPAHQLRHWLSERVAANSRFRRQMAANALRNRPPLGLISDFKLTGSRDAHPHTVDLKVQGVTPFVDGARLIALANRIAKTNTLARLQAAVELGVVNRRDSEAWMEAYQFIQLLRMQNHQHQQKRGEPLSNHLNPDALNELNRRILKESYRQARKLQAKLELEYQL